jgi:hypothetical protein
MLGFCSLSAVDTVLVVDDLVKRYSIHTPHLSLVLMGHVKNFSVRAESALKRFISWTADNDDFEFLVFGD